MEELKKYYPELQGKQEIYFGGIEASFPNLSILLQYKGKNLIILLIFFIIFHFIFFLEFIIISSKLYHIFVTFLFYIFAKKIITFLDRVRVSGEGNRKNQKFLASIGVCQILKIQNKTRVEITIDQNRNKSVAVYMTDPTYITKYSINYASHIGAVINVRFYYF